MNFRMLKEESTGLNYFKDREREKPKVSFELWASGFPARESRGDIKSKKKIRKAVKKMLRENLIFEFSKQ